MNVVEKEPHPKLNGPAAAAVGLLGAWGAKPAETAAQEPPVVALTKAARDQMTADQILEKWKEGNLRFREGRQIPRDFLAEQAVARRNVELTIANIRKNSKVIAELEKAGAVKIAGAFYDLKPGAVEFFA